MCYMFSGPSVIADCSAVCSFPIFPAICWDTCAKCEAAFVLWVSLCRPTWGWGKWISWDLYLGQVEREEGIECAFCTWKRRGKCNARNAEGYPKISQGQVSSLCAVWSTEAHDSTQATWRVKATIGVQNSAIFHCPTVIVPEKNGKTIRLHSPSFASMPWSVYLLSQDQLNGHLQRSLGNIFGNLPAHHVCRVTYAYVCCCWRSLDVTAHLVVLWYRLYIYIYDPGSRFATTPPPLPWYGPKTCVLQHSAWKRGICSVSCMVGGWRGPQTCKFVGFPATDLPKTCYLQCLGFDIVE